MNRGEALRTLGLDDDATSEQIRVAYRESAQILHPDRFAGNKRLQERATEQFKNLQEAYDFLTSGKGARGGRAARGGGSGGGSRGGGRAAQLEAQLAGINAARVQLQAQRDAFIDQRQRGLLIGVAGLLVAFFLRRIVWLAGIGGAAAFWGFYDAVRAHGSVTDLTEQLDALAKQKKQIQRELEDL